MSRINVARSGLPPFEEFCGEIRDLWDSHWLTNMGEKHRQLEAELRAYFDVPYVTLYTNGHLALEGALEALGLTGEVITTPFTFASTTHAIVRCGCQPVFADIDPETFTLDPEGIERLITGRTTAILPVHVYGNLCHVNEIQAIADRHGLKVVYDAAHAIGVRRQGVSAACFGDLSMFSFHATKVFHTIEGGALTYRDPGLKKTLDGLKNFGIEGPEDVTAPGSNAKMSEFQAAMGLCNLRHLQQEIDRRRLVVERYTQRLDGVRGLRLNRTPPGVTPNHAYLPVVFDGFLYSRDEVFERLKRQDIIARKYFYPLTNAFACYAGKPGFDPAKTPAAAWLADRVLTLPLYGELALEDVDRICDIILS